MWVDAFPHQEKFVVGSSLSRGGVRRGRASSSRDDVTEQKSLFLFRLFRHPLEAILHVLHLTAKIVDVVFRRGLRRVLRLGGRRVSGAGRRERLEHREGPP